MRFLIIYLDSSGRVVNGVKKPIKYIHQLQNLYFSLTQKELKLKNNIKT